jgi:hypothetical protein
VFSFVLSWSLWSAPVSEPAPQSRAVPATEAGVTPFEPRTHTPPAPPPRSDEPDRKTAHMVRIPLLFGPVWRIRPTDPLLMTGVEYGRMHGFSGAFHLSFVLPRPKSSDERVRVLDTSLSVGPVLRGRLRRPLYGSIALTLGIRIHRAATDTGVVHRVDPELRLPIQGAWTFAKVGLSLALVQGYGFRARAYEQRGEVLWRRAAYHVGLLLGLHLDLLTGSKRRDHPSRRRARR